MRSLVEVKVEAGRKVGRVGGGDYVRVYGVVVERRRRATRGDGRTRGASLMKSLVLKILGDGAQEASCVIPVVPSTDQRTLRQHGCLF